MIQRKQTLYLLVVIALYVSLFFMDIASVKSADGVLFNLSLFSDIPFMVLSILVLVVSLAALLTYKKLALQLRLSIVNIVLNVGFMAMEGYVLYKLSTVDGEMALHVAAFLPIAATIFAFLAFKGVSKDIFRLRSYNRMR